MTFIGRVSTAAAFTFALALAAPRAWAQSQGALPMASPTPAPNAAASEVAPVTPLPSAAAPAPTATPTSPEPEAPSVDDAAKIAELIGQDGAAAAEPSLKFYGFADFNTTQLIQLSAKWKAVVPEELSLYLGRLNVYMEGNIAQNWKSLVEVRYMFLPNGATTTDGLTDPIANTGRFNGIAADYADLGRPIAWGGISIQRAYLEHNFTNFLSVRVGRFLTPWGIWNVDHGSPVIIGPSKPYIIGESLFPEAQTGFDAFGSVSVGESTTLGYHLTLSNGRGPTEATADGDNNKAIGGRLSLKMYVLGQINVGFSGYGGTVTDKRQEIDLAAHSLAFFNYEHYREVSWSADVQWTWKELHFQSEAALHDRVWDHNARPVNGLGVQSDVRRLAIYGLLAYRLPWFNLMPYTLLQYYDTGSRGALLGQVNRGYSFGLNVRFNPSVVFKIEYTLVTFDNPVAGSMLEDPLRLVSSQLAWAF
jgi:hypothetical protein